MKPLGVILQGSSVFRKVSSVLVLFLLLACGKGRSTGPSPQPTPLPSPTSTPVPHSAWPWGAIICCDDPRTPSVDEGYRDGWALANPGPLHEMASAGATLTHFRTGPFRDGSSSIPSLVVAVQAANSLGIRPEVDLIDNWALANGETPWGDGCEVTHSAPRPRHLKHVREVVEATAAYDVTYNLGNEGFRCNPEPEWDKGLYAEAKAAGARRVGSNSGLGIGDYFTTHGFEPACGGNILTEDDGGDHTPEEWIDLYRRSRSCGGQVMFWRGTMSDAQWADLLNRMRNE